MIEVAVAIGVIAILAGAVAPLALKALNQQREQKTRENLKIAYESLFGSRDRRVSNMRADFGYNPQAALADLRFMTTRTSVGAAQQPPVYAPNPGAGFSWGWNGPYWTGTVQPLVGVAGGLPADGWGRAIRLAIVGGNWQLQSAGINGTFGNADDLVFPLTGLLLTQAQMRTTLVVNAVNKTTNPLTQVTLQIQSRAQQPALPGLIQRQVNAGAGLTAPPGGNTLSAPGLAVDSNYLFSSSWITTQLPGPLTITLTALPSGSSGPVVLDLLPGEARTLDLYLH